MKSDSIIGGPQSAATPPPDVYVPTPQWLDVALGAVYEIGPLVRMLREEFKRAMSEPDDFDEHTLHSAAVGILTRVSQLNIATLWALTKDGDSFDNVYRTVYDERPPLAEAGNV